MTVAHAHLRRLPRMPRSCQHIARPGLSYSSSARYFSHYHTVWPVVEKLQPSLSAQSEHSPGVAMRGTRLSRVATVPRSFKCGLPFRRRNWSLSFISLPFPAAGVRAATCSAIKSTDAAIVLVHSTCGHSSDVLRGIALATKS